MLRTRPKIEFGDSEPYTEFVFPTPVDAYDPFQPTELKSESVALDGTPQSVFWHIVDHITFVAPVFEDAERCDFMNHYYVYLCTGKPFWFYPDYQGGARYRVKFTQGWLPRFRPLQPGVAWSISFDLRRTDVRGPQ